MRKEPVRIEFISGTYFRTGSDAIAITYFYDNSLTGITRFKWDIPKDIWEEVENSNTHKKIYIVVYDKQVTADKTKLKYWYYSEKNKVYAKRKAYNLMKTI